MVGLDGAYWKNRQGVMFHFLHFVDESTLFHVATPCGRTVDEQIRAFEDNWLQWAGPCKTFYLDPAGEYVNDRWADNLQKENIKAQMTAGASPWQFGRCERHGKILKDMLTRMDSEDPIEDADKFRQCLRQACAAKNSFSRIKGFTPEQALLGKSRVLPASLVGDEELGSHLLAESSSPEGIAHRRNLERREQARRAFILQTMIRRSGEHS